MRNFFVPFIFLFASYPGFSQTATVIEIPDDGGERTPQQLRAEAYYLSGEQKMDAGQNEQALRLFTAAQSLGYNTADLNFRKGRIYEDLGQRDSACVYFRKAGDLGDEEAKAFVRVRCGK